MDVLEIIEEEERVAVLRRERVFRDRLDPLDAFDDIELYRRYRFTREGIMLLADMLNLQADTRRNHALPSHLKVCLGLQYLATSSFQQVVGDNIRVSQSTVSRSVRDFVDGMVTLVPELIQWPTAEESEESKHFFYDKFHIPNVVGCIDGTHVQIIAPSADEEVAYVNRNSYHSINVQVVCDSRNRLINVVANKPGSYHDSTVLRESNLYEEFEQGNRSGIILGDSGYACSNWLLPPFRENQIQGRRERMRFNSFQKRARAIIERTIGQVKRRFAILHGEIRLSPARAVKAILACAALHNLAKRLHMPEIETELEAEGQVQPPIPIYIGRENAGMRDLIVRRHFMQ